MGRGNEQSPLGRVLRDVFGDGFDPRAVKSRATRDQITPAIVDPRSASGLGGVMEERDPSNIGNRPGQMYAGGPQTQQPGLRGQVSEGLMKRWDHLFRGKNPARCGPIATHECADIISRILEQTFRNFQLTARPPSHLAPPFSATPIDSWPTAGNVLLLVGVFVPVVTFTMPAGNYRGVISALGQSLETEAAFFDVAWRIRKNSQIVTPPGTWSPAHAYQFSPPTHLQTPIQLRGGDIVTFEAFAIVGAGHMASARLAGWFYPVRVEMDNSIGSTLVD